MGLFRVVQGVGYSKRLTKNGHRRRIRATPGSNSSRPRDRWSATPVKKLLKLGQARPYRAKGNRKEPTKMAKQLCISADSHVVESVEFFEPLRKRFGDAAPRVE